jgi:sterol desaturase/sphingolipid hydroxylase (fatty acid hydroxylase superfamily)
MESFVVALNYAIPGFVILISIEAIYAHFFAGVKLRNLDTISSLSSGVTNIIKDVLGLTIFLITYQFIESRIGIFDIKAGAFAFILTFMYKDFAGYWKHRFEHSVNFFWNHHIVHHSSEEYNLPCALRQSISEIIDTGIFFIFPLAIIGVPIEVMALVAPIHLFAQFWYHTKFINKMGVLEKVIVTPSHHRVHHAINPEYIDKNYSQIFIFWDKLFGTFQEELPDVPPVYGVKKAVQTWNPFLINFQHAWLIFTDAWRTKSWKDKLRIWFMPTGWRPADVAEKYPIEIIQDVYKQKKYDTNASKALTAWAWVLLIFNLGLMLYLFNHLSVIQKPDIFILGGFILFSIFSYTSLMDKKRYALPLEMIKGIIGFFFIYTQKDFFLINEWISFGSVLMMVYFGLSMVLAAYFEIVEFKDSRDVKLA